jgi:hypothetical protein
MRIISLIEDRKVIQAILKHNPRLSLGCSPSVVRKIPVEPRRMAENAPYPPLYPNSPKPLLKKPPTNPQMLCQKSLDTQFPFCIINSPQSEFLSIIIRLNLIFQKGVGTCAID